MIRAELQRLCKLETKQIISLFTSENQQLFLPTISSENQQLVMFEKSRETKII